MESLLLKIRLSVLWLFMAVAMLAHSMVFFMEPGVIEEVMSGVVEGVAMGPEMLFVMSIVCWVPLVMAFLSVTLKDSPNRWTNITVGIVFTIFNIFHFIQHLAHPSAHMILFLGSVIVATALIVWYAWKWPVQVSTR